MPYVFEGFHYVSIMNACKVQALKYHEIKHVVLPFPAAEWDIRKSPQWKEVTGDLDTRSIQVHDFRDNLEYADADSNSIRDFITMLTELKGNIVLIYNDRKPFFLIVAFLVATKQCSPIQALAITSAAYRWTGVNFAITKKEFSTLSKLATAEGLELDKKLQLDAESKFQAPLFLTEGNNIKFNEDCYLDAMKPTFSFLNDVLKGCPKGLTRYDTVCPIDQYL